MTGIPIAGITHDMSKFSPTEFWEGVKYYQGNRSPIEACKEINGYSEAWFHHKGRNKHHYEYWVDNLDCGGTPTKMPYRYAKELICDYIAAGRAYMGDDFTYQMELEWWYRKLEKPLAMHSCTKAFVTDVFIHLANGESERAVLSDKWLKEIYWMTNYCDNW
jgi:hypothetical protein